MAITIRNKQTEELIRKIGRRTGEGPSAVIARLAKQEASGKSDKVPEEEVKRRMQRFAELAQKYPPPDPKPAREDIEREVDSLYEYLEVNPPSGRRRRG